VQSICHAEKQSRRKRISQRKPTLLLGIKLMTFPALKPNARVIPGSEIQNS
jgi:hypothetical protein